MTRLLGEGRQLVLVTSGAVAAGAPVMGLTGAAKTIPQLQACAAVGQSLLMSLYERLFSRARPAHGAESFSPGTT